MKIKNFLNNIKIFYFIKKINHSIVKNDKDNHIKSKKNVLVEFNAFCFMHIILSVFIRVLKKNHDCKLFAYPSHMLLSYDIEYNFIQKIKKKIALLFNLGTFGIYKSLGIKNFLEFKIDENIKILSKIEKIKIIKSLKVKNDVNKIRINGVLVGDLIYDTFLKKKYDLDPTIDIHSKKFIDFLEKFLQLFFLWEIFILKKKINLVLCSHNVYTLGIPARICAFQKGEAYIIEYNRLTRLNNKNIFKYSIAKYYRKIFSKFKRTKQKEFIDIAKNSLKSRFQGSLKDIDYMTSSAFNKNKVKLKISSKLIKKYKILVSPHDFVDAPHVHGEFIFPDMYEWIKYLCEISKSSPYLWLVKTHPLMKEKYKSYQKYTRKVINRLIKNSKLILINPNISHNDLINKYKIDCVLTVTGTIAHEYAFHGIKVINASASNIHSSYKFNFHAKSIGDYEKMIKNINLKPKFNLNEIASFYYMHYLYVDKNWFFENLNLLIKDIGGYHNLSSYKIYDEWTKIFSNEYLKKTTKNLENFLKSKDLVYTQQHREIK
jgi:hypothetical protein